MAFEAALRGLKTFGDEMQERRARSTVRFISKPRKASGEDADASAGPRRCGVDAASPRSY
jgi:hypothetical protein